MMIQFINTHGDVRSIPLTTFHDSQAPKKFNGRGNFSEIAMHTPTTDTGFDLNYELSHTFSEMKLQFNGMGGPIDEASFYFDYQSAEDWLGVNKEFNFFSVLGYLPIGWITDTILSHIEESDLISVKDSATFIGLGPGDAKNEIQLIGNLLNKRRIHITLNLLDLSHYLLHQGYKEAKELLGRRGVKVFPYEGNFHNLHRMQKLFCGSHEKQRQIRIGCMFGNTFGNLTNETNFLHDSLSAFHPGDLLIVDVGLIYAPLDQPEEILRTDPRLSRYTGQELWENWLIGPIHRYRPGVKKIELKNVLDTKSSPVPGSYTVLIQAVVDDQAQFNLIRIRRYDETKLAQVFVESGWRSRGGRHFGEDKKRICYIFEKV